MARAFSSVLGVVAVGVVGAGLGGSAARAAAIPVANPSFESPVVDPTFLPVSLSPAGWSTAGPSADVDTDGPGPDPARNSGTGIFPNPAPGPTRFTNADGNQLAYIFTSAGEEFFQTLSTNFAAGGLGANVYRLTVGVGNATAAPAPTEELRLQLFYTNPGDNPADPTKRVVVASRAVRNDATDQLSGTLLKDFSASTAPIVATDVAVVGRPINVLITTTGAGGAQFDFDNVRVDTVPEPTTAAVAGVTGVGLLAARRRRRRATAASGCS